MYINSGKVSLSLSAVSYSLRNELQSMAIKVHARLFANGMP